MDLQEMVGGTVSMATTSVVHVLAEAPLVQEAATTALQVGVTVRRTTRQMLYLYLCLTALPHVLQPVPQEQEELQHADQLRLHAHRQVAAQRVAVQRQRVLHALVTTELHSHVAVQRLVQVAQRLHRQEHAAVAQELLAAQVAAQALVQEQRLHVAQEVLPEAQVLLHAAAHHEALLEAAAQVHVALASTWFE